MYRFLALLLVMSSSVLINQYSIAQADRILKVSFLDSFLLGPTAKHPLLGGISAMEWIPQNKIQSSSKTSSSLFLFTDHTPNKPEAGTFQRTLVFDFDVKSKQLKNNVFPFDSSNKYVINSVEAVRYSQALNTVFYSYESGTTGIVRLNKNKKPDTLLSISTPANRENRGIEAMCFARDNSLWYCLESGIDDNSGYIAFNRIRYDQKKKAHDLRFQEIYLYPFDKCSCLSDSLCHRFNQIYGNGVTELLALPKELGDGFLVLERCFNGTRNQVRLYEARIAAEGLISKTLVFDFNEAQLKPDNLEGMAWGPKDHGRNILYLISDDNYNYKSKTPQRTQMIRLSVGL